MRDDAIVDGALDLSKLWEPTPKNKILRASTATNRLRVGGTGSGKTVDSLMETVCEYLLRWDGCAALFMRRHLKELRESAMLDFKEFVPEELYKWDGDTGPVTFFNGSKLFWGNCPNNSEKDLHRYLSAAFPVIVMDECGQFSWEAWRFMGTRNRVNRECKPDEFGEYPTPVQLGNTNPMGPHWPAYNTVFVKKRPYDLPDGARRDKNGRYWVMEAGEWRLIHDPLEYEYSHSTLLDNPYMLKRDPDLHRKLSAMPKDQRDKYLDGKLDTTAGAYFDCWDESRVVVDLAAEPEAVIWQPWQPRWMSWDWGRAHHSAVYWWTIALVRNLAGEYVERCVCYREYLDRGKSYEALATNVAAMTKNGLPGEKTAWSIKSIFFSHEKFAKTDLASRNPGHSPAVEITRELTKRGLPGVTRNNAAAGSRVGKATLMYDYLQKPKVYILATCTGIIEAIPSLVRDEKNLEDVLKLETKEDDCYDGFAMGLYNWFGVARKPQEVRDQERIEAIDDPMQKALERYKVTMNRQTKAKEPERKPEWM